MDVCGSCGSKGLSGATVDGAIEEGHSYFKRRRYEEAKACYTKALNILSSNGGCFNCKRAINQLIDKC